MRDEGRRTKTIGSVRELEVYQLAFKAAMEIFELSKSFPKEVKILSIRSDTQIFAFGLYESLRSMAEAQV
ncbi:MAG: four helix bundle protein [Sedimentisphaerales bacterium]|nr:four helix bundle protein [Sedimentisphaerales bacterium]